MRRNPSIGPRGFPLALLMLLPLAAPIWLGYSAWAEQHAEIQSWDLHGPPCPVSAAPLTSATGRPPQTFDYAGVRFERRSGAVSCAVLETGSWWRPKQDHVCQFSAPVTLVVTSGRASTAYAPGAGRSATVRIADGAISCVLAGWFKG